MSRASILAAIRQATRGAHDPEPPRDYRRTLAEGTDLVALLVDRLEDYRAEVEQIAQRDLATTLGRILGRQAAVPVVVPDDLDGAWLTTVTNRVLRDSGDVPRADLDGIATITGCAVAVAQTGTIMLDGGALQGRRIASLLPDLHICLVRRDQIVGTVAEGITRLRPTAPQTWISGPSATSDIELERVEGVHGPRRLVVLIVG